MSLEFGFKWEAQAIKDAIRSIPAHKESYYDEKAREKRRSRAQQKVLRDRLFTIREPPRFPRRDMTLYIDEDDDEHWLSKFPLRRPRPETYDWENETENQVNAIWQRDTQDFLYQCRSRYFSDRSPDLERKRSTSEVCTHKFHHSARLVFGINELLEAILRRATPEALLLAYSFPPWREMAAYVISTTATESGYVKSSYPAIAYGERIDFSIPLALSEPSTEELEIFEVAVTKGQQMLEELPPMHTEIVPIYFPARLTQARNLPHEVAAKSRTFHNDQSDLINEGLIHLIRGSIKNGRTYTDLASTLGAPGGPQPEPHTPSWLDFTQVNINPFFSSLFSDRFSVEQGRCDIIVKDSTADGLMDTSFVTPDLRDLVNSMFVTHPPSKCMRLYTWSTEGGSCGDTMIPGHYFAVELTEVVDEQGMRIGQLLRAIENFVEEAIDTWFDGSRTLMQLVWDAHWKHDIWCLPNAPKISILLGNNSGDVNAYDQWIQLKNHDARVERQAQWMPIEAMKPPRPKAQDLEFLPGLYSLCLNEHVFGNVQGSNSERCDLYRRVVEKIVDNLEKGRDLAEDIPRGGPPPWRGRY